MNGVVVRNEGEEGIGGGTSVKAYAVTKVVPLVHASTSHRQHVVARWAKEEAHH
jgi:hypothetical protein